MSKPIILTKILVVATKPKTKSVIWDIVDKYPVTLELSYTCQYSAGCVASVDIKNLHNGRRHVDLKPHNVSRALSHAEWYSV